MVKSNTNIDRRGPVTVEDCHIGRRMEIRMAEVITKIENIEKDQTLQRQERQEMKSDIKSILAKFDSLDKKYASKEEVKSTNDFSTLVNKKVNWFITATITAMFSIIMFLIKLLI